MSGGIDFSNVAAPFPYHDLIPSALREPAGVELIPGTVSHLGLIYRSVLGYRPLRLDLHRPQDADGPVPIVVYVHGGSFIGGVPEMGPWTSLPASGIAVAAISYRLAGEAAFPGPVDDIVPGCHGCTETAGGGVWIGRDSDCGEALPGASSQRSSPCTLLPVRESTLSSSTTR